MRLCSDYAGGVNSNCAFKNVGNCVNGPVDLGSVKDDACLWTQGFAYTADSCPTKITTTTTKTFKYPITTWLYGIGSGL